jgi:hypothetical protein
MPNDNTPKLGVRHYSAEDIRYFMAPMRGLDGLELPCVQLLTDNSFWWPITAICEDVLHVQPWRQLQRLRNSSKTANLIHPFRLRTGAGLRDVQFLADIGLAEWLDDINSKKVADPAASEKIELFQRGTMWAKNMIMLGRLQPVSVDQTTPQLPRVTVAELQQELHQQYDFVEKRILPMERLLVPYIDESEVEREGIINIPFVVDRPGHYIIRLRQMPWNKPEVLAIIPDPDREIETDEE